MTLVLKARRLIDGTGAPATHNAEVHLDGATITYAGPSTQAPPPPPKAEVRDFPEGTLLPGLTDCHAHPLLPYYPPDPDAVFTWSDEVKLLASVDQLRRALHSGVTTLRDCGAPHSTAFALRCALDQGLVEGPTLVSCGRMICPTGGHGHQHGGEADGPDGVRHEVRRLFKEGADFIKLTATGGGTARTLRHRATFTVDELRVAAEEAAARETYATAHCHGIEGMKRCLDAGVQMIEHGTFVGLDGREHFDPDLAAQIRDQDVVVVPTLQVHARWVEQRKGKFDELSPTDKAFWPHRSDSLERRIEIVSRLHDAGVTLLLGSDSAWRTGPIDDLALGLELHVRAGIPPLQVIASATGLAAQRLGLSTGVIAPGRPADVILVDGDPLAEMAAMRRVRLVVQAGAIRRAALV